MRAPPASGVKATGHDEATEEGYPNGFSNPDQSDRQRLGSDRRLPPPSGRSNGRDQRHGGDLRPAESGRIPNADALLSALTAGENLPEEEDYLQDVIATVPIALICDWDLGARAWWFYRVHSQESINRVRVELSERPDQLAAFESFNRNFEVAYPEMAQSLSLAVDQIHHERWEEAGGETLRELQLQLEVALGKLVADRQLAAL